jgi:uncharacterized SAM-binding protein YcdF (DUF218 family)
VAAGILLAGSIAWGAGFLWFLRTIMQAPTLPAHADGIVALTGGAERVETGLRLLAEGRADRLLLSGIGPATELATLARRAAVDPAPLADRITLGRAAVSTRGNAAETAAWLKETRIISLIVVTAYYHMPRAMAELGPAVHGVELYPYPVGGDVGHRVGISLLVDEYSKYLAALVGLTAWLPSKETPHGVAGS